MSFPFGGRQRTRLEQESCPRTPIFPMSCSKPPTRKVVRRASAGQCSNRARRKVSNAHLVARRCRFSRVDRRGERANGREVLLFEPPGHRIETHADTADFVARADFRTALRSPPETAVRQSPARQWAVRLRSMRSSPRPRDRDGSEDNAHAQPCAFPSRTPNRPGGRLKALPAGFAAEDTGAVRKRYERPSTSPFAVAFATGVAGKEAVLLGASLGRKLSPRWPSPASEETSASASSFAVRTMASRLELTVTTPTILALRASRIGPRLSAGRRQAPCRWTPLSPRSSLDPRSTFVTAVHSRGTIPPPLRMAVSSLPQWSRRRIYAGRSPRRLRRVRT